MELVETLEINGEEREIADAYARGQIATNAQNIATNAEGIAGLNNNLVTQQPFDKLHGYCINFENKLLYDADSESIIFKVKKGSKYTLTTNGDRNNVGFSANYPSVGETLSNVTLETNEVIAPIDGYCVWYVNSKLNISIVSSVETNNVGGVASEIVNINDSLSVIGKCKNLLNSTLQTTTINGVTCTNNGDGTYTLDGTASANATFRVCQLEIQKYLGKTLRLVGCPKGGSGTTYRMFLTDNQNSNSSLTDLGGGATKTVEQWGSSEYWICYISIDSGVTVSNVVFKPMLTTNLNATYDDFVPYTGDGETLTHDVAELKNDLSDSLPIGTILTVVDSATMSSDMWKLLKTGTLSYQDGGALVQISTITYQKIK